MFSAHAWGEHLKPISQHWAIRLHEYCSDLKKASITTAEWQMLAETLYSQVELEEILKFIEFDKLVKGFEYPDRGVNTKPVRFP